MNLDKLQDASQQIFDEYDREFWRERLAGWRVLKRLYLVLGASAAPPEKAILVNPLIEDEQQLRETLIHEMCHATSTLDLMAFWRQELKRVQAAGAPTDLIDFLEPYDEFNSMASSCRDYARRGESLGSNLGRNQASMPLVRTRAFTLSDLN